MKQQDLMNLSASERIDYIEARWKFMIQEIEKIGGQWKYTSPSGMSDCNLTLDMGSMRFVLRDESCRFFTFFGKFSSDSGMPQHGEFIDDVRRYYFVGRFWAGEKPERCVRSPNSPMPSSKKIFQDYQSSPPPISKRSQYECPSDSQDVVDVRYNEYCSCDCCKRTFSRHKKQPILKRHGYGQMAFEDGRFYDGQFHNDQYHGTGTFHWADGRCYRGEYKYGHKHGRGKLSHSNGMFHVGQYFQSRRHGFGVAYSPQRGAWYCGFYEDDARHGHGMVLFDDPHIDKVRWRQGQWAHNRPCGRFTGVLNDFTPFEEIYNNEGKMTSERSLVMENLKEQLGRTFQDFCDIIVVCTFVGGVNYSNVEKQPALKDESNEETV
mmetsp:Transcript_3806/g.14441  ORF Transcript_3806/g.14441 Transcript_3806/m.14441 type:complete len:378 (-) Transcript_3806:1014-2147(-)|eukprot:CAMPEP_0117443242 /NCGR_PEP_ID=MMETSP0759-20121206/4590_1 /TAXON_ID=63605 /ORGANISM="Percolomonas cosmopolitus, Strain WS" /LENGTH=377 /DNA_ID=CAMNT_0005235203 /DNA_START=210 /DNA_END=1343 /DNA_ORIENTATION=-